MGRPSNTREVAGSVEKQCTRCLQWKAANLSAFSRFKDGVLQLHPWCRDCLREYARAAQARLGKPVRKPQALPGAPPRIQHPAPEAIERFLDRSCGDIPDKSRFKVYLIRNEITGQCYVGITERDIRLRWKQHLLDAHKGGGYLLHSALREHGVENFCFAHVASARTRTELNALEQVLVKQYRSVEDGYNQTRGGSAGESVGQTVTVAGRKFISLNAAARHYGVEEATAHQRLKLHGWTLEQALGITPAPARTSSRGRPIEVNGVHFRKFKEACKHHGLDVSLVNSRLTCGWSHEQAFGLASPPRKGRNAGHRIEVNGISYKNVVQAEEALSLKPGTAASRLHRGWSVAQAFGVEPPPAREPKGTEVEVAGTRYRSVTEACRKLGKVKGAVASRLQLGWSVDQAFDLAPPPPPSGEKNGQAVTVGSVTYSSRAKAAAAHRLDPRQVHKRLNQLGWTIEQALGIEPSPVRQRRSAKRIA